MAGSLDTPRIFISYSWSNPKHEQWVIELGQRLMADGINVVLDKWDLKEGQDLHKFMERMVNDTKIDKVLVICDKEYQLKANARKGGVGAESQLISKEIYDNTEQEKFIPIVKEYRDGKPCIPSFMASRIYIDLSIDEIFEREYEKLIRNLYGKPETKKPPLGAAPVFILDQEENPSRAVQELQRAKLEATSTSSADSSGIIVDFLESLLSDLELYRLVGGSEAEFDEKVVKSIEKLKKLRDVFVDFAIKMFRNSKNIDLDSYKSFFEKSLTLLQPQEDAKQWTMLDFDNFKFFIYELFLYFIATLIRERKFEEASYFINGNYFFRQRYSGQELSYGGIEIFNHYPQSLEEIRNKRLNLRRISITADLIKERATRVDINFEQIKQTDLILYVITAINNHGREIWFPRTSVYRSRFGENIELFEKMISSSHFERMKFLFKISSKTELAQKLEIYNKALEEGKTRRIGTWDYHIPKISEVINIGNIATID